MAEEGGGSTQGSFEQLVWTFVVLFFIVQVINTVPANIKARTGIDLLHPIQSIQNQTTLGPNTPLGTKVRTTVGTDVFSMAQGGALIGFQPADVTGRLFEGPSESDSTRFWNVDFERGADGWVSESALSPTKSWIASFISTYTFIAYAASFILLTLLLYFAFQHNKIRAIEARRLKAQLPKQVEVRHNERWERVLRHADSACPGDWRMGIIEADVMLDEMVTKMGYRGASLGEKLKQIDPSDFTTINDAWEAHKTRNRIAHSGSDFILTQREAKRVVGLYENVFREFQYI